MSNGLRLSERRSHRPCPPPTPPLPCKCGGVGVPGLDVASETSLPVMSPGHSPTRATRSLKGPRVTLSRLGRGRGLG